MEKKIYVVKPAYWDNEECEWIHEDALYFSSFAKGHAYIESKLASYKRAFPNGVVIDQTKSLCSGDDVRFDFDYPNRDTMSWLMTSAEIDAEY